MSHRAPAILKVGTGSIGARRIRMSALPLLRQGRIRRCAELTLDSFVKGMESIRNYHDIFNGPEVNFGPTIRQGANSSFLALVKDGRWTRLTQPLGF